MLKAHAFCPLGKKHVHVCAFGPSDQKHTPLGYSWCPKDIKSTHLVCPICPEDKLGTRARAFCPLDKKHVLKAHAFEATLQKHVHVCAFEATLQKHTPGVPN